MRNTARNIPPLALLVFAVLLSWLSYSVFSGAEREKLISERLKADRILLTRLQAQIEHSYREDDLHWIQDAIASLGAENEILRVSLAGPDLQILADMRRSNLLLRLPESLLPIDAEHQQLQQKMEALLGNLVRGQNLSSAQQNYLGAVYPVLLTQDGVSSRRGFLWMETDLRRIKALANQQIGQQTIAVMIGFVVLAACMAVLFHVVITRRIAKLVNTMTKVAEGDMHARVSISSNDEFGRLGRYFNEMLDRRQSVERALHQSQKLESIGTLASGIAHDFNNILQAISGYVRLAEARAPEGDADLQRYLEKIDTASNRATKLVQQILSFSRSSELVFTPVSVQRVIDESLTLLQPSVPPDILVERDIQTDCRAVLADPTQLQQVVTNLITNSIQAVDAKSGRILVALREIQLEEETTTLTGSIPADVYAELIIEDNGEGIAEEQKDRLFDPFYTTKDVGHGTGLGLSIVHGVIKSSGGGLLIESEPMAGTRVVALLPVVQQNTQTDSSSDNEATFVATPECHKVLLVDDDKDVLHSTASLLREIGADVVVAATVDSAVTAVEKGDFDVAILDFRMPVMNGTELASRLNSIRPIPVIIATGFLDRDQISSDRSSSIKRVISKPYSLESLAEAIRCTIRP